MENVAPFHGQSNNFQVDQVWFGMEKAASADSRGGYRLDLVFGESSDAFADIDDDSNGSLPYLYQAYAQYLAPVTEGGISIKAGRYETIIGAAHMSPLTHVEPVVTAINGHLEMHRSG